MTNQNLNLTNSEYDALVGLSDQIEGMSVKSALEVFAELSIAKNESEALSERQKLIPAGRISSRLVPIRADVYFKLTDIAKCPYKEYLMRLLFGGAIVAYTCDGNLIAVFVPSMPVKLTPSYSFMSFFPQRIVKNTNMAVQMDTAAPSKDIEVKLVKLDGSVVDSKTVTSDANGIAQTTVLVPENFTEKRIKLQISQVVIAKADFQLEEDVKHFEEHNLVVL